MTRILTGIKPTGRPHLGNYVGAIRPALQEVSSSECIFFVADLHALTAPIEAELLRSYTREVAATWLALGLDPQKVIFFRQSDIPEIPTLNWILCCYTNLGLLERAHAYKSAREKGKSIHAGLFTYPVLMAADILSFAAQQIPVGEDQKQHIEYARDMAQSFNHVHGEIFTLPEARIRAGTGILPGVDGQKMSKSYQNTIPIFAHPKEIKKAIASIQTDSTPLEEPKNPDQSFVFQIYQHFASPAKIQEMRDNLCRGNYGYGDAKKELLQVLTETFGIPQARYEEMLTHPNDLEDIFADGARKARPLAQATLDKVRQAVGIGSQRLKI